MLVFIPSCQAAASRDIFLVPLVKLSLRGDLPEAQLSAEIVLK